MKNDFDKNNFITYTFKSPVSLKRVREFMRVGGINSLTHFPSWLRYIKRDISYNLYVGIFISYNCYCNTNLNMLSMTLSISSLRFNTSTLGDSVVNSVSSTVSPPVAI